MSKMNKKKVISVLFSLVLAFSLAACSGTAQTQPELAAGTGAASNLTASNIATSGSSDRQEETSASKTEAKVQNSNPDTIVKAAVEQNKENCVTSTPVTASGNPSSSAGNSASQPASAAAKVSNSVAANTVSLPKNTTGTKTSDCLTSNNNQVQAVLSSLCGQNGSIVSNSVSGKLPCSVYLCQDSVCGKVNCNTTTCVTTFCKSNSCSSGNTSSSGKSGSTGGTSSSGKSGSTGTTSSGSTSTAGQSNSAIANQVLELINAERAKNGLAALTMNTNAQKAAQVRATEIVTQFSHTRPSGESCFTALKEFNVSYSTAGENIAYGQPDAKSVVNAWMNSSGHRANILKASFKQTGIGVYKDSKGVYYWTQMFIG